MAIKDVKNAKRKTSSSKPFTYYDALAGKEVTVQRTTSYYDARSGKNQTIGSNGVAANPIARPSSFRSQLADEKDSAYKKAMEEASARSAAQATRLQQQRARSQDIRNNPDQYINNLIDQYNRTMTAVEKGNMGSEYAAQTFANLDRSSRDIAAQMRQAGIDAPDYYETLSALQGESQTAGKHYAAESMRDSNQLALDAGQQQFLNTLTDPNEKLEYLMSVDPARANTMLENMEQSAKNWTEIYRKQLEELTPTQTPYLRYGEGAATTASDSEARKRNAEIRSLQNRLAEAESDYEALSNREWYAEMQKYPAIVFDRARKQGNEEQAEIAWSYLSATDPTRAKQMAEEILAEMTRERQELVDLYNADPFSFSDESDQRWAYLDEEITKWNELLHKATYQMEGVRMGDVARADSESYDPRFAEFSQYNSIGEYLEPEQMNVAGRIYEYINNDDTAYRMRLAAETDTLTGIPYAADFEKYQLMNDEEIALFNYYYVNDPEQALHYLDTISETLNYRAAVEDYKENWKGKPWKEALLGAWQSGFNQYLAGSESVGHMIAGDNYIPTTKGEYLAGMMREDLSDSALATGVFDVGSSITNMLPSVLVSSVSPVAGKIVFGASVTGNAYKEAVNNGFDPKAARWYAGAIGAAEVFLQDALGGISKMSGANNLTDKVVNGLLSKVDNAIARAAIQLGASSMGEATEEYLQEIIGPVLENAILGAHNDINLISEEAIYAGILGAFTALPMNMASPGTEGFIGNIGTAMRENLVATVNKPYASEVVAEAKTYNAGSETLKRIEKQMAKGGTENISNRDLALLVQENAAVAKKDERPTFQPKPKSTEEKPKRTIPVNKNGTATTDAGESVAVRGVGFVDGDVLVRVADENGTERNVSRSTLALSDDVADLVDLAAQYGYAAPAVYAAFDNSMDFDRYASDVEMIMSMAKGSVGVNGTKALNWLKNNQTIKMEPEAIETLFAAGREIGIKEQPLIRRGTGKVTFAEGIDRTQLKDRQKAQVEFLEEFAKLVGVDIEFFESSVENGQYVGENGSYIDNRIRIDLNAGRNYESDSMAKIAITRTASHELTHWLKDIAPKEYMALRSFVVEKMIDEGGGTLQDLIDEKKRRAGGKLSTDEAIDEIVADGCELMLGKSEYIREYAEKNAKGFEAIKNWLKKFLSKLKAAFKGVDSVHRESVVLMAEKNIDKMIALWDNALKAGLENPATTPAAKAESKSAEASEAKKDAQQKAEHKGEKLSAREQYSPRVSKKLEDKYYARQIDQWDGKDHGGSFRIGRVSKPLLDVGIPDVDIWFDQSKAAKQLENKAEITKSVLKKIPELLANPIVISESYDHTVVVLGKLHDETGKPIVVALRINSINRRNHVTLVNKVRSVGRRWTDLGKILDESNIVYLGKNKKDTQAWFNALGRSTPFGGTKLGYIRSVTFAPPKINPSNKNIFEKKSDRDVFDRAEKRFGTTTDFNEAGFILPNGKMLRFTDDDHRGERIYDHRAIGMEYGVDVDLGANHGYNAESNQHLDAFVADGGIRFYPGDMDNDMDAGIQISGTKPLTKAQEWTIREFVEWKENREANYDPSEDVFSLYRGPLAIHVEFGDSAASSSFGRSGSNTITYEGGNINADRIINDIRHYHRTGELRKPSTVSQFRYSERDPLTEDITRLEQQIKKLEQGKKDAFVAGEMRVARQAGKDIRQREERIAKLEQDLEATKEKYRTSIGEARIKAKQKQENLEAQIKKLKRDSRDDLKEMREKLAALKKQDAQRLRDYRANRNESDAVKKYRKRIESRVKDLQDLLFTNTDKKHIPEPLKEPLARFLDDLMPQMYSRSLYEKGEGTNRDAVIQNTMRKLGEVITKQTAAQNGMNDGEFNFDGYLDLPAEMAEEFSKLQDAFGKIAANANIDEPIYQLSSADLQRLDWFLSTLKHSINRMNQLLSAPKQSVLDAAKSTIDETSKLGEAKVRGKVGTTAASFLNWDNATPFYVFKRLGEGGKTIFNAIASGWDKLAFNSKAVIDFSEETYTSKEVKNWTQEVHDFELSSGETVRMTDAQLMALYCLSNRPQAMSHLLGGGIRVANIEKGKNKIQQSEPRLLTIGDIEMLIESLSDRQRSVADKIQRFMTEQGSKWGNEVSMARFGYRAFTEDTYFPIVSDQNNFAAIDPEARANDLFRLLNISATKALTPNANNAIVIEDIFNVYANHMSDMAKYNALALPVLDAFKWLNYKEEAKLESGQKETVTVQRALEKAYGKKAQNYLVTFLKDLNAAHSGGRRDSGFFNVLSSNAKVASVAANVRVALLQPTAYLKAALLMNPKWLAAGAALTSKQHKAAVAEMKKHSGIALWKSLGFYDTNISRSITAQIKNDESLKDKIVDKSMFLAEKADEITWGYLWNACKREVLATKHLHDEALLEATAERFREIVYATQVVDSTLTRSHLMRDKDGASKLYTSFMSEPTLAYNMVLDQYNEFLKVYRETGSKGRALNDTHKGLLRAFGVYGTTAIATALFEALTDVMREDEEKYKVWEKAAWSKFLHYWLDNSLDNLNPFSMIPMLRDLVSVLQGFAIERQDMAWATDLVNGIMSLIEIIQLKSGKLDTPTKLTYYGNMTGYGAVYKLLQGISGLTGLPVGAGIRELQTLWNNSIGLVREDLIWKTYDAGDEADIRSAYENGYISAEEAQRRFEGIGMKPNDAYWEVQKMGGTDEEALLSAALISGTGFDEAAQTLLDHGYRQKDIESKVNTLVKKWLQGVSPRQKPWICWSSTAASTKQRQRPRHRSGRCMWKPAMTILKSKTFCWTAPSPKMMPSS